MIKLPEFDKEKAIAVILYIAPRVDNSTIMRILKLMYLADKTSLEKYGRFVSSDSYVAMEQGPVPTEAYDLMKKARTHNTHGFKVQKNHEIRVTAPANEDELSESDIEILDDTIKQYGNLDIGVLLDKAHDKAWLEVWEKAGDKKSVAIPIEKIANLSDHGKEIIEFLTHSHD